MEGKSWDNSQLIWLLHEHTYIFSLIRPPYNILWFDRSVLKCTSERCCICRESGQIPYSHHWWSVPNLSSLSLPTLISLSFNIFRLKVAVEYTFYDAVILFRGFRQVFSANIICLYVTCWFTFCSTCMTVIYTKIVW